MGFEKGDIIKTLHPLDLFSDDVWVIVGKEFDKSSNITTYLLHGYYQNVDLKKTQKLSRKIEVVIIDDIDFLEIKFPFNNETDINGVKWVHADSKITDYFEKQIKNKRIKL
jgi:hypothetical protein